ncbi:serine carboxypeptidase-like 45 [Jatropha curcas]|uniref:serine carboxypeptidase-like 45 n=1 Tax=Jatropha curcas TaxID=180498 RepID=UPI001894F2B8|nr:serine carboxypeptidase-like 45 [Jatropha curcas]
MIVVVLPETASVCNFLLGTFRGRQNTCRLQPVFGMFKAIWFFSLLLFLLFFLKSGSELLKNLPRQPSNVSFKQYSGYIVTDAKEGRDLFYYFVEAETANPLSLPLTLWLNGESNMLFVESPIGIGFSYSNTSSNYEFSNDTTTAEDNLKFLVNWLEEFPVHKESQLFVAGESYAGNFNVNTYICRPLYSSAFSLNSGLGNPLLDLDISVLAGDYLWAHGAISDETLMLDKTVCNDSKNIREYVHDLRSQGCNDVFNRVADEIGDDVARVDLLSPICLSTTSMEQFKPKGKHWKIHATICPNCFPFLWPFVYQEDNLDMNLIPLIAELLKERIPVLLYR